MVEDGGQMKQHDRIQMNPDIMFGKAVIKNSRITVELIMQKLAGGMTIEDILNDHHHLTREDILAAHEFAADYLADEEVAFV
jgi:uncharacterized protein (DUF433 family)